jgi:hypothetical protein
MKKKELYICRPAHEAGDEALSPFSTPSGRSETMSSCHDVPVIEAMLDLSC